MSNGDLSTCEDYVLFLHVKRSCFRAKAHQVFHWCFYNNFVLVITKTLSACPLKVEHSTTYYKFLTTLI